MTGVSGSGGLVVSPHRLATEAGADVLAAGGNAVDAAIAANAMLGAVAPETCGIGGDLFALVFQQGEVTCLDASGWAGTGADADSLRREGLTRIPSHHPQTVTIPGCVAGWTELSGTHGSVELPDLLEPAEHAARDGFPTSTSLARAIAARADQLIAQPHGEDLFLDGRPPPPGGVIRRPGLAAALRRVREGGELGFYRGPTAHAIVEATGGVIELDDLASFAPEWVAPLHLDVFGVTGWTVPPASQGYLTLASAAVVERLTPNPDPRDPQTLHLVIESYRAMAARRDEVLADRRHLPAEWRYQLEPEHLARVASSIDPDRARPLEVLRETPGGTAYLCAIDKAGMAVSLIQSNYSGIGSGIGAAGFFLHNRGAGFDLRQGHPNELAPGKRPLHTLSPTIWTRSGALAAAVGTRGGHQQPQIMLNVVSALFGAGLDAAAAIELPRWTTDHQSPMPMIEVESRMPEPVVNHLSRRGHAIEVRSAYETGWGPVSAIVVTPTGVIGHADPRVDTASAAGPGATPTGA